MATSSSWDYSRTAAQIIQAAYEDIAVVAPGGTISSANSTLALDRLNKLAKQYQGTADGLQGLKVHTRQRITLFLAKGQHTYLIGPASTDARATTAHGRTTLDAAEAAGQTVLSVTATTDTTTNPGTTVTMTASDFIGIQTDDSGGDDIHWSTISSVSVGDTVTIADALPTARPAASGNYVWWFTSRAQRFPVIESAVLRNSDLNDSPLFIYRDVREYDVDNSAKYSDGTPTAILVEPLRITTRVTLNSQPTDVTDTIILTVLYPSEDYDATTDDIAFPQEWLGFIEWELAFRLAPVFGSPWTQERKDNHAIAKAIVSALNPEVSNAYFQCGESG